MQLSVSTLSLTVVRHDTSGLLVCDCYTMLPRESEINISVEQLASGWIHTPSTVTVHTRRRYRLGCTTSAWVVGYTHLDDISHLVSEKLCKNCFVKFPPILIRPSQTAALPTFTANRKEVLNLKMKNNSPEVDPIFSRVLFSVGWVPRILYIYCSVFLLQFVFLPWFMERRLPWGRPPRS